MKTGNKQAHIDALCKFKIGDRVICRDHEYTVGFIQIYVTDETYYVLYTLEYYMTYTTGRDEETLQLVEEIS